jgi:thioesterase domain-containing protein
MQATPVTWRLLLEAGWQGGKGFKALVGGEALPKNLADQLIACGVELWNLYGPTETTVWSTCTRIADTSNGITIGKPIANTTVYILDTQKNLCPIGVPGELCIGGDGVTLGYWKRPELTAERFIPDPFSTAPGATLYRTGDLARWRNDGTLEHLGRLDFQVKIRGFRIELGEIETNIANYPAVRETVVIVREDVPGDPRLVAYVVPRNGEITAADLMQHLSHRLPPYMVPSAFVMLEALPLTPNAKIDRKALPAPEHSGSEATYIAPRSPTEEALAVSWRKTLQLQRVGIHDNFFELGGHSLMFAKMISEINSMFKSRLGMAELIRNPTVEQFARLIDTQQPLPSKLSTVVLLQEGRAELPVYFIYAGPGEFRVAQHMAGSHPVFGIEARWPLAWRNAVSDNQTSAFPSMEQMVAPYVAELSAHTRSTPCALAGFCYAGQIAFEAAQQLQKLGGKVELVILIDTPVRPLNRYQLAWQIWRQAWKQPPNSLSTDRVFQSLGSRMSSTWHTTWWLLGKVKQRLRSYFNRPEPDLNTLSGVLDEQGMPVPWGLLARLYEEMAKTYYLRSLDSRAVLFRTGELDGKQIAYAPDDALGWENLFTQGLEIIPVAGHHFSIWGKQIPAIAREINRALGQRSPDQDDKE